MILLCFLGFEKESQGRDSAVKHVPPPAAADAADVQQRQRFDTWGAEGLRNRQCFACAVPLGRSPSAAVAGSVLVLGVR